MLSAFFAVVLAGCASGGGPKRAELPEDVGFASARLQEISRWLQSGVERREIPGAVVPIARHGKVAWFEAVGFRDRESSVPMTEDWERMRTLVYRALSDPAER